MTKERELAEAIEYFSAEEKRLGHIFKIYWLMILMGIACICLQIYSFNQASHLAAYSEEITETVSPKTVEQMLTVMDSKIDLLRSELNITSNYTSLYIGGLLIGAGIAFILSHKQRLKKVQVIKNAISHIPKNS